jgi:sugar phosphate isomerase/epimerase
MNGSLNLGCAEFAVPGVTLEEKLKVLESRGVWLELVNDCRKQARDVLNAQKSFGAPIESVQAYLLHELEMLGENETQRKAAARHVEDTIKLASEVGAKNVVVTIAYGEPKIENPRKKCIELFRNFGKLGEEFNVTISIEPLGRDRTSFLPSVPEVHRLVQDIGSDHVRLMADTMHIYNSEKNVADVVRKYVAEIMELQLRDTGSRPPGLGKIDFVPILKLVREKFRGLICLEYKPGPDPDADFNHAIKFVGRAISAAR